MGKSNSGLYKSILTVLTLVFVISCGPTPRRDLTEFEKQTDLYWLFSQFEQNYAPLKYKQNKWLFDYEALKQQTISKSNKVQSNEDFYLLAHEFVAKFADGHTRAQLTPASLPARAKVAYLGFKGQREGDNFQVTDLLPTYKADPNSVAQFPIKANDRILEINGMSLKDYYTQNLKKYKNIGNEEANYTAFFGSIFQRSSLYDPIPNAAIVTLKIKRGTDEMEVELPWVKKDLYLFNQEQNKAANANKPADKAAKVFHLNCFDQRGLFSYEQCPEAQNFIRNHAGFNFWDTFKRFDYDLTWKISDVDEDGKIIPTAEVTDPLKALKEKRFVPANAIFVQQSSTYPAYVTRQKDENDQYSLVGVIHLDTFSPATEEKEVLKEFKATLKAFKGLGVERLVIDTVNNGGGSLILGMGLAQNLSKDKIAFPGMKFRLSETWIDQFERDSLFGLNDTTKELNLRVFKALMSDKTAGDWLSREFNATTLTTKSFEVNKDLKDGNFKTVLLINEMCASMCDIFAGMLQDNGLATVVGVQTMGAGGNVVMHAAAPNSGMYVSQTESLIIRSNGEYLENNGVKPDVPFSVNESVATKYDKVLKEGFKQVLKL